MNKFFYRVGTDSTEGLWYNKEGVHTGLIHTEFNWLSASSLIMPFELELIGYISVADSLEHLYNWFTRDEILKLQENGFSISEYIADDYKFYDLYKHNVINKNSVLHNKIKLI
jgi:hypothetical protein